MSCNMNSVALTAGNTLFTGKRFSPISARKYACIQNLDSVNPISIIHNPDSVEVSTSPLFPLECFDTVGPGETWEPVLAPCNDFIVYAGDETGFAGAPVDIVFISDDISGIT